MAQRRGTTTKQKKRRNLDSLEAVLTREAKRYREMLESLRLGAGHHIMKAAELEPADLKARPSVANMGGPCLPMGSVSESGTLSIQIDRAMMAVANIHERIEHLERRLDTALTPSGGSEQARTGAPINPPAACNMASRVCQIADGAEAALSRIISIRDRVDL